MRGSELKLQRELHDTWVISLRKESPEIRIPQVFPRVVQVGHDWVIEHIKKLRPELQLALFRDTPG